MKILYIFTLFLLFFIPDNILAQQENAIYIYRSDNTLNMYACSKIDSIIYEKNNFSINQIIWKDGIANLIPIEDIDSVSFELPKNAILQIPEDDLNGWSYGCCLGEEYIVAYKDSLTNTLVTMINKKGSDIESGLIICFDEDNNVINFGNIKKMYNVRYEDDNIILYCINEDNTYEEKIISCLSNTRTFSYVTSTADKWNFIYKGIDFINNIKSVGSISSDLVNWNWEQLVYDGALIAGGSIVGKIPVLGTISTVGQFYVDFYINQQYERQREAMYKDCEVSIDEVRIENGNTVVYATVNNANSLPDYLFNWFEKIENEETRNLVSCGIIVRANNKYLTIDLFDYQSQQIQLNGDIDYGTESYLSFCIPELDLTKNLSTFYFCPYLISTRLSDSKGSVDKRYIKYGPIVSYKAFNGEIKDLILYSAQYNTDLSDHGFVIFRTKVHAIIKSLNNVDEWGVYVLNDNGIYDYYPSDFGGNTKLDDWIDIDFNINEENFDELNYDENVAMKGIQIGLYQKIKNPTGSYDYLSYFYSEPQMYELTYEEKFHQICTNTVMNVTETSAVLSGEVSGISGFLSDCRYGFFYGTSSVPSVGGQEIQVGSNRDGEYSYSLSNLKDNTTYYYCAYLSVDGQYTYGDVRSFTTEKKKDEITPGQMVDLGLSVKWAGWNVGASRPEEYGGYYAWGELHEKSDYVYHTYQYFQQKTDNWSDEKNWIFIGNNISGTQYDVAQAQWGAGWRMPTKDEIEELINKCNWTWMTYNGVKGNKVTGPNGNSIFLPATGMRNGTDISLRGSTGLYWSSTGVNRGADCLYFYNSYARWDRYFRIYGYSVRPVSE